MNKILASFRHSPTFLVLLSSVALADLPPKDYAYACKVSRPYSSVWSISGVSALLTLQGSVNDLNGLILEAIEKSGWCNPNYGPPPCSYTNLRYSGPTQSGILFDIVYSNGIMRAANTILVPRCAPSAEYIWTGGPSAMCSKSMYKPGQGWSWYPAIVVDPTNLGYTFYDWTWTVCGPDAKKAGEPNPNACVANPVDITSGNKFQSEELYRGEGPAPLIARLHYNSRHPSPSAFGHSWHFEYQRIISTSYTTNLEVVAVRQDGQGIVFRKSGTSWIPDADVSATLIELTDGSGNRTGWQFKNDLDELENYNATGQVVSIVKRTGLITLIGYDNRGNLTSVTDPFGRQLSIAYSTANSMAQSLTDSAGNTYQLSYDTKNNLVSITFPDSIVRQYLYNEVGLVVGGDVPHALTGIIDENGSRFATWMYDSIGRALSSQHAGGANLTTFSYPSATSTTAIDARGTQRTYQHTPLLNLSKLTTIDKPCERVEAYSYATTAYDPTGYAKARTDFNGNITNLVENARGLETSRTEGFGSSQARTITTEWHPTFRLPVLITEPGRTTAFTHDPDGNILTKAVTDTALSRSRTWTYTYNGVGQFLTADGPRTDVSDLTTYTYHPDTDPVLGKRGNVATVTNADGHVTWIPNYDANGRPLTIVDPNGLTTTLTYHPRGWLTSRTVGTEVTIYDYDFVGQLKKVTLPDSSFLEYFYDAAHRLIEVHDNLGNKIVYTLDAMGNRTAENVRDPANTLAQTRTRVYNSLNRLFQDIGGSNPATQITQYGYDNQGNLTTIDGPLPGTIDVTTKGYDALNRLRQVTNPASGVTQYGFNALDQLTSVTDPRNNPTVYNVDALDNLNQQVSPDTGSTVNTYDAAGNVLTSQDAKNQTTTYIYDALNRVTRITYHDGSEIHYGYDAGINGKGRLTSITENAAGGALQTQVLYGYDPHGRIKSETRTLGAGAFVTQYGYDAAGRQNSITYPSGRLVAYSFDGAGRVSGITTTPAGGSAQTVVSAVSYYPFGGVKGFTFGNGQSYSRTTDLDGRIAGYSLGNGSYTVGFDGASRITSLALSGGPSNTYGYDNLDRLTSAVMPSTSQSFGYDANGNRTTRTVGAVTSTYAYPATNNKLSNITAGSTRTYVHDPNGSIVNDGVNGFTYDVRGRLIAAATALGSVTYGLNSLGQRYAKTLQGVTTLFHYDKDGRLIAESDPAGALKREYLYLGDIPVGVQ